MRQIELVILRNEVSWVEADVLALKYASRFYGADKAVASLLIDHEICSEKEIVEGIEADGYFHVESEPLIQSRSVLFIKTPPQEAFRYRQVRQFSRLVLELAQQHANDCSSVALTIHGAGFGLDISVSFLSQIAGLLDALGNNSFPSNLKGISIVERDSERASLLSNLLQARFAGESYSHQSVTGAAQILDIEILQETRKLSSNRIESSKR